jgi:hypothetical protein
MKNQSTATEAGKTIDRINRLRIAFGGITPDNQRKIIDLLSAEIETVEDEAVKLWLVKFRSILEHVQTEGAR